MSKPKTITLFVMATLCANLSGLGDAQISGKILFLDVSMRVFLEEIII